MKKIIGIFIVLFFLAINVYASDEAGSDTAKKYKTIGIGYEIGWPFYGLNVDYWPVWQHGFSINYQTDRSSYGAGYSDERSHISLKYKYRLSDDSYVALGAGRYTDNQHYVSYSSSSNKSSYYENILAITIGFMNNDVSSYELGYASTSSPSGRRYESACFSTRLHYYF